MKTLSAYLLYWKVSCFFYLEISSVGQSNNECWEIWLQWCDIHLVPVRFMNSGAVIAETWAAGRPVIQSDAVDPDYVVNGEIGQAGLEPATTV